MFYSIKYSDSIFVDVSMANDTLASTDHLASLYNTTRKILIFFSKSKTPQIAPKKPKLFLSKLGNTSSAVQTQEFEKIDPTYVSITSIDFLLKIDENNALLAGQTEDEFGRNKATLIVFSLDLKF